MKTRKTNASRILDSLGIPYELLKYEFEEKQLDAVHVAETIGRPPAQVFKTLCLRGDKTGVLFACIPGDGELDLKQVAKISMNKKVEIVPLKEVLPLTGYIRGGVSPLGAKKEFPVILDESAFCWEEILLSAGQRGTQLLLSPENLRQAVKAKIARIAIR